MLAMVLLLLLMGWYVSAWLAMSLAAQDGDLPRGALEASVPVFAPIVRYCELGLPGADSLSRLWHGVIEHIESAEDEEIEIVIGLRSGRIAPPPPSCD